MLRYGADIRTWIYVAVTTALLVVQWSRETFSPALFIASLFMAVSVSVLAHQIDPSLHESSLWKFLIRGACSPCGGGGANGRRRATPHENTWQSTDACFVWANVGWIFSLG